MKLYIWKDVYSVKYGAAFLYSIADSIEQARELALNAKTSEYGYAPKPDSRSQVEPSIVNGPPDRIVDLPYAEVYEWSE